MIFENFYSRFVAWLKILLPLVALAILSSVVFFARESEDQRTIPFITQEGGPDTPDERVTHPEFVGVTGDGSAITMRATRVRPIDGNTSLLRAEEISGTLESMEGRIIDATAPEGKIDFDNDVADLFGEVVVDTSDGYHVVTQDLRARLDITDMKSDGPVVGTAPFGTLEADRMRLFEDASEENVLVFNGHVKLVYDPRN